jgi:FKBP-type peptidyl-prolyl cis-trans isomerase FkpA
MLIKTKQKMKRTIVVLFAISLVACNINYEKTASGLAYKIFKGNGTEKPKPGEFIKFNLLFNLADRDSVLQSTFNKIPVYSPLDTGKRTAYTYMEVLQLMNVGDSAEVSINIDSLKSKGMIDNYNPILVKGQVIIARIKLLQVFKDEKSMVADYEKSIEREKDLEIKLLEDYMSKNNIKGVKTKNGAFVVVENPGDTALKADSGKLASVMYRGYLTTTGKVFDTNMDTTKGHTDPYQFVVGSRGGSIEGFNETLPYFGKGGKGKILIPAMLGYGGQPQGEDLPAFSNLVFDIEVKDVQIPPATSQNPMMQMQQQPH